MLFISYGNISMLAKKNSPQHSHYSLFLGCWCFEQQMWTSPVS
ncbi:unnamed protein product, partial [Vitis vinifera]